MTTRPSGFCRSEPILPRNTLGAMPMRHDARLGRQGLGARGLRLRPDRRRACREGRKKADDPLPDALTACPRTAHLLAVDHENAEYRVILQERNAWPVRALSRSAVARRKGLPFGRSLATLFRVARAREGASRR